MWERPGRASYRGDSWGFQDSPFAAEAARMLAERFVLRNLDALLDRSVIDPADEICIELKA